MLLSRCYGYRCHGIVMITMLYSHGNFDVVVTVLTKGVYLQVLVELLLADGTGGFRYFLLDPGLVQPLYSSTREKDTVTNRERQASANVFTALPGEDTVTNRETGLSQPLYSSTRGRDTVTN